MALTIGSKADVVMLNVLIEQVNPDQTYALIRLPDAGDPLEYWIPAQDARVTIKPILPASWPPKEGDVWTVPGITPAGFVVSDGANGLFFLTPDAIRAVYGGNTALPITTDQALADYGSALTLLYRAPA